ncbi:hypothetical protein TTHERM_001321553 (macronuclear) [Tetrahymena thermophila SB210]|uniref:Uncharacterized protein n=1 Tax=Tetrahymena thermophila (strain SB210) TaxID=312017 RepID=W7XFC3_TETTS|nr:hypothetical protein TTHERM_001321553 [Tetrahymena thermophila SB210]EWS75528.1 hypothetical protein TTHERM_001321553 [Tetrahymena thermophila SB210]|eukprot:XP_012651935.1 hypothetical protein TTHERM_001321553 [Tetrahymena thermophila SB210]
MQIILIINYQRIFLTNFMNYLLQIFSDNNQMYLKNQWKLFQMKVMIDFLIASHLLFKNQKQSAFQNNLIDLMIFYNHLILQKSKIEYQEIIRIIDYYLQSSNFSFQQQIECITKINFSKNKRFYQLYDFIANIQTTQIYQLVQQSLIKRKQEWLKAHKSIGRQMVCNHLQQLLNLSPFYQIFYSIKWLFFQNIFACKKSFIEVYLVKLESNV